MGVNFAELNENYVKVVQNNLEIDYKIDTSLSFKQ